MKYIVFWEFCPEDIDKVIEKSKQAMAEREKGSEKFPKIIFPAHSLCDEFKGFTIEEATPEQIANLVFQYMPEMRVKFVPILESAKIIEQYLKMKK